MPTLIDEVSVDVERDAPHGSAPSTPAAAPQAPDPREQIERELRLLAERKARIQAD